MLMAPNMTLNLIPVEQKPSETAAIEDLLDQAFGLSRHAKTSYRLREGNHPIPGLSLVIHDDEGGLVGAISFWPIAIGLNQTPALLLGPLAVHPQHQNQGIGMALMKEGLARAKVAGHALVLLVGDLPYYARVGFGRTPSGQLELPGPVDPARLLYLELTPAALAKAHGLVLAPWRWQELSAPHATMSA